MHIQGFAMVKRSRKTKMHLGIYLLQTLLVVVALTGVGLVALGFIPLPNAVEMLAVVTICLLGLPILALYWLIFEMNRPDLE